MNLSFITFYCFPYTPSCVNFAQFWIFWELWPLGPVPHARGVSELVCTPAILSQTDGWIRHCEGSPTHRLCSEAVSVSRLGVVRRFCRAACPGLHQPTDGGGG